MMYRLQKSLLNLAKGVPFKKLFYLAVSSFFMASVFSLLVAWKYAPKVGKSKYKLEKSTYAEKGVVEVNYRRLLRLEGKKIIERLIFNSDGEIPPEDREEGERVINDNRVATQLDIKLRGVIFGGTSDNGVALIENKEGGRATVNSFQIGEPIKIGSNVVSMTEIFPDRIYIDNDGAKEYLVVHKEEVKPNTRRVKKGASLASRSPLSSLPGRSDIASSDFKEEGFEKSGLNISFSNAYKENLLNQENLRKVLQDAKLVPVKGGFKFQNIKSNNNIFEKFGFAKNDIIKEVNGVPLNDPGKAVALLKKLKNEKNFSIIVQRNGKPHELNINQTN